MTRCLILIGAFSLMACAQNTQNTQLPVTLVSVISGINNQPPVTENYIYGIGYGCCSSVSGGAMSDEVLPSGQTETISFQTGSNTFLDVQSFHFTGGQGSSMVLTFDFANSDQLVLTDPSPQYHGNATTGAARVTFGTGLFNGATGSFNYSMQCQDNCETLNGLLIAPNIVFQASGSGTLFLPQPALSLEQVRTNINFSSVPATLGQADGQFTVMVRAGGAGGGNTNVVHTDAITKASSSNSNTPSFNMAVQPQPVPVEYSLSASCSSASTSCWITVASSSGTIPALTATTLSASLALSGSGTGSYPATITLILTPQTNPPQSAATLTYPITLLVNPPGPVLQISQDGVYLTAPLGAPVSAAYPVTIVNSGNEPMPFSVTPIALSGGNWLTVSPPSGTVAPNSSETLNVVAITNGLAAHRYFGQIQITAPGASGSPQSTFVALDIGDGSPTLTPGAMALVFPAGIKYTTGLDMVNNANQPVTAAVSTETDQSSPWLTAATQTYSLDIGATAADPILVDTTNLLPGTYTGSISVNFSGNDGPVTVPVKMVINPAAPPPVSANTRIHANAASVCTPTQLLVALTAIGNGFPVTVGLPVAIEVQAMDDCGTPIISDNGFLGVSLSNGDSEFPLLSLGNGTWTGTWMPHLFSSSPVTVTVTATTFIPALQGSASLTGALVANPNLPLISTGGVVSAASLAANAPIAPGSYISIFGANFASAPRVAPSLPLTTNLGGVQVLLGGEALPLQYVGPGQINAIVPYDVPVNATQQLVIQNGAYSLPESVPLAPAQPAIFTQNASGTGAGAIQVIHSGGAPFLNTPSSPAQAGDALAIYCTGLGAVNPPVAAGTAASLTTLTRTVETITVTVGGQNAQVLFSGLAPGFAGLYQVNVLVPEGVATGPSVPVVVSAAGVSSPAVTVAVQ